MTREEFIAIAGASLERFNPADIDRPIGESALDSLDLLILRSGLETHLGHAIRDEDWFRSNSLRELIALLP
jgi:acyl carrier protein